MPIKGRLDLNDPQDKHMILSLSKIELAEQFVKLFNGIDNERHESKLIIDRQLAEINRLKQENAHLKKLAQARLNVILNRDVQIT